MTGKASEANELLCDNNTVKFHHFNRSVFFKENLAFWTKYSVKKQFFLFPTKFIRISLRIKQAKYRKWLSKLLTDRRERDIVWQQHCKDSSCQLVRFFFKKTWLSRWDLSLKTILFISNKVYKDVKANKARRTLPMTKKALNAIELLCDSHRHSRFMLQ